MSDMFAGPPLTCWIISDGRRGIENQALGLAEAIHDIRPLKISQHVMQAGKAFMAASPKMQFTMRSDPAKYGLLSPYPSLAIGCGRQAVAPLMALKKAVSSVYTVYIQDPRVEASNFDLVVAPEHDNLIGPNIISMIGSPNRIHNRELVANVLAFNEKLADLPMPRVAMLIGGDSKTHKMTRDMHVQHMKAANDVLAGGRSLMVTTSRRTPDWVVADYKKLSQSHSDVWVYDGGDPNPYFAYLGASDTILVTEDSTNMLTEACTTGKHVFTLPMRGKPGKFQALYDRLYERCHVEPFKSVFKTQTYEPLNETARVAQTLLERLERRVRGVSDKPWNIPCDTV